MVLVLLHALHYLGQLRPSDPRHHLGTVLASVDPAEPARREQPRSEADEPLLGAEQAGLRADELGAIGPAGDARGGLEPPPWPGCYQLRRGRRRRNELSDCAAAPCTAPCRRARRSRRRRTARARSPRRCWPGAAPSSPGSRWAGCATPSGGSMKLCALQLRSARRSGVHPHQ